MTGNARAHKVACIDCVFTEDCTEWWPVELNKCSVLMKGLIMRQLLKIVFVMLVSLGVSSCSIEMPESYQPLPKSVQITPFSLYDQDGQTITTDTLKGHWSLAFFGYTYCPDVCPTTLAEINRAAKEITKEDLQVVLISVDPERDTPKQLKSYIEYFNPKFQAWSGEKSQLEAIGRQLHIFFQKNGDGENYLMDHSSQVVLINPQGEYQGYFTSPLNPAEMAGYINSL
jgi:protein SCO1/2